MREVIIGHDIEGEWDAHIPEGWTIVRFGIGDDGRGLLHCTGPDEGPMPTTERTA